MFNIKFLKGYNYLVYYDKCTDKIAFIVSLNSEALNNKLIYLSPSLFVKIDLDEKI